MQDKEIIVKTIKKEFNDRIRAGITWYTFISAINDIKIAKRELQLLSYINFRGTISSTSAKEEFCKMFNSSSATISNMTSKLMKKKLLVKEKSKIKVTPSLRVDFSKEFVVRFFINTIEEVSNEN